MKPVSIGLLLSILSLTIYGQSSEDSVKACINQLFTAMNTGDSALLVSCFTQNGKLQSIINNKDGITARDELVNKFASSVSKAPKGSLDERISFDMIKMDGPLASVWTPYSFYYNGKLSHCGVNSFQLLRTIAGWKIQYIIDARRKDGCL